MRERGKERVQRRETQSREWESESERSRAREREMWIGRRLVRFNKLYYVKCTILKMKYKTVQVGIMCSYFCHICVFTLYIVCILYLLSLLIDVTLFHTQIDLHSVILLLIILVIRLTAYIMYIHEGYSCVHENRRYFMSDVVRMDNRVVSHLIWPQYYCCSPTTCFLEGNNTLWNNLDSSTF